MFRHFPVRMFPSPVFYILSSSANTNGGLSPGVHTQRYAEKCMRERKRRLERSRLPSAKRRRLELKQERCLTKGATEVLEGATYQSEIALQADVDIEKVPDAVPRGDFKPLQLDSSELTFLVLDLETTDLIRNGRMPHLTQIAAREVEYGKEFSSYILPKMPISQGAQQTTGICVAGGVMFVNGTEVHTVDLQCAIDNFLKWLKQYNSPVLVAHNGRKFDFPVLTSAITNAHKLEEFLTCVVGCLDTLPLFRKTYPNRSNYKQEDLARDILGIQYNAHNAIEDVRSLVKLFQHSVMLDPDFMKLTFSFKAMYNQTRSLKEKAKNLPTLTCLVASSVCKAPTAENIASSGLNLEHLRKIYLRDGEDGLYATFTSKNSEGQPRVTNTKRTLENVVPNIVNFFKKT